MKLVHFLMVLSIESVREKEMKRIKTGWVGKRGFIRPRNIEARSEIEMNLL